MKALKLREKREEKSKTSMEYLNTDSVQGQRFDRTRDKQNKNGKSDTSKWCDFDSKARSLHSMPDTEVGNYTMKDTDVKSSTLKQTERKERTKHSSETLGKDGISCKFTGSGQRNGSSKQKSETRDSEGKDSSVTLSRHVKGTSKKNKDKDNHQALKHKGLDHPKEHDRNDSRKYVLGEQVEADARGDGAQENDFESQNNRTVQCAAERDIHGPKFDRGEDDAAAEISRKQNKDDNYSHKEKRHCKVDDKSQDLESIRKNKKRKEEGKEIDRMRKENMCEKRNLKQKDEIKTKTDGNISNKVKVKEIECKKLTNSSEDNRFKTSLEKNQDRMDIHVTRGEKVSVPKVMDLRELLTQRRSQSSIKPSSETTIRTESCRAQIDRENMSNDNVFNTGQSKQGLQEVSKHFQDQNEIILSKEEVDKRRKSQELSKDKYFLESVKSNLSKKNKNKTSPKTKNEFHKTYNCDVSTNGKLIPSKCSEGSKSCNGRDLVSYEDFGPYDKSATESRQNMDGFSRHDQLTIEMMTLNGKTSIDEQHSELSANKNNVLTKVKEKDTEIIESKTVVSNTAANQKCDSIRDNGIMDTTTLDVCDTSDIVTNSFCKEHVDELPARTLQNDKVKRISGSNSDEVFSEMESVYIANKVERRRSSEKKKKNYRRVTSETISSVTSSEESPSVEEFLKHLRQECESKEREDGQINMVQDEQINNVQDEVDVNNKDKNCVAKNDIKIKHPLCLKEGCLIKVSHIHPKPKLCTKIVDTSQAQNSFTSIDEVEVPCSSVDSTQIFSENTEHSCISETAADTQTDYSTNDLATSIHIDKSNQREEGHSVDPLTKCNIFAEKPLNSHDTTLKMRCAESVIDTPAIDQNNPVGAMSFEESAKDEGRSGNMIMFNYQTTCEQNQKEMESNGTSSASNQNVNEKKQNTEKDNGNSFIDDAAEKVEYSTSSLEDDSSSSDDDSESYTSSEFDSSSSTDSSSNTDESRDERKTPKSFETVEIRDHSTTNYVHSKPMKSPLENSVENENFNSVVNLRSITNNRELITQNSTHHIESDHRAERNTVTSREGNNLVCMVKNPKSTQSHRHIDTYSGEKCKVLQTKSFLLQSLLYGIDMVVQQKKEDEKCLLKKSFLTDKSNEHSADGGNDVQTSVNESVDIKETAGNKMNLVFNNTKRSDSELVRREQCLQKINAYKNTDIVKIDCDRKGNSSDDIKDINTKSLNKAVNLTNQNITFDKYVGPGEGLGNNKNNDVCDHEVNNSNLDDKVNKQAFNDLDASTVEKNIFGSPLSLSSEDSNSLTSSSGSESGSDLTSDSDSLSDSSSSSSESSDDGSDAEDKTLPKLSRNESFSKTVTVKDRHSSTGTVASISPKPYNNPFIIQDELPKFICDDIELEKTEINSEFIQSSQLISVSNRNMAVPQECIRQTVQETDQKEEECCQQESSTTEYDISKLNDFENFDERNYPNGKTKEKKCKNDEIQSAYPMILSKEVEKYQKTCETNKEKKEAQSRKSGSNSNYLVSVRNGNECALNLLLQEKKVVGGTPQTNNKTDTEDIITNERCINTINEDCVQAESIEIRLSDSASVPPANKDDKKVVSVKEKSVYKTRKRNDHVQIENIKIKSPDSREVPRHSSGNSEKMPKPDSINKKQMPMSTKLVKNHPKESQMASKSDSTISGSILRLVNKSSESVKEKGKKPKSLLASPKKMSNKTLSSDSLSNGQKPSVSGIAKNSKLTFEHKALPEYKDPAKELTESLVKLTAYHDRVREIEKKWKDQEKKSKTCKKSKTPPSMYGRKKAVISSDTEDYDVGEVNIKGNGVSSQDIPSLENFNMGTAISHSRNCEKEKKREFDIACKDDPKHINTDIPKTKEVPQSFESALIGLENYQLLNANKKPKSKCRKSDERSSVKYNERKQDTFPRLSVKTTRKMKAKMDPNPSLALDCPTIAKFTTTNCLTEKAMEGHQGLQVHSSENQKTECMVTKESEDFYKVKTRVLKLDSVGKDLNTFSVKDNIKVVDCSLSEDSYSDSDSSGSDLQSDGNNSMVRAIFGSSHSSSEKEKKHKNPANQETTKDKLMKERKKKTIEEISNLDDKLIKLYSSRRQEPISKPVSKSTDVIAGKLYEENSNKSESNVLKLLSPRENAQKGKDIDKVKTVKAKTNESLKTSKSRVNDSVITVKTKTNEALNTLRTKTNDVKTVKYKTNESVNTIEAKTNEGVETVNAKVDDGVYAVKVKANESIKTFKDNNNDSIHCVKAKTNESVNTLKAKTNEGVNSLKTKTNESVNKVKTKTNESVNTVKPKTNKSVNAVKPKANENVNAMKAKTIDTVMSVKPEIIESVNTVKLKINEGVGTVKTIINERVHTVKAVRSEFVTFSEAKTSESLNTENAKISETEDTAKAKKSDSVNSVNFTESNTGKACNIKEKSVTDFILEDADVLDIVDYEDDLSLGLDASESEIQDSVSVADAPKVDNLQNEHTHEGYSIPIEDGEVSSDCESGITEGNGDVVERLCKVITIRQKGDVRTGTFEGSVKPFSPIKFPSPVNSPSTPDRYSQDDFYESAINEFIPSKGALSKRKRSLSHSNSDEKHTPVRRASVRDYRHRSRSPKVKRYLPRTDKGHASKRSPLRRALRSGRSRSNSRSRAKRSRSHSGSGEDSEDRCRAQKPRPPYKRIGRKSSSEHSSSDDDSTSRRDSASRRYYINKYSRDRLSRRPKSDSSTRYDSPYRRVKYYSRNVSRKDCESDEMCSFDRNSIKHRLNNKKRKGVRSEKGNEDYSPYRERYREKCSTSNKRRYMSSSDDECVYVKESELKRRRSERSETPQPPETNNLTDNKDSATLREPSRRKTSSEKENVSSPYCKKRGDSGRKIFQHRVV